VIPGYGFLSENVKFAEEITNTEMVFVGPSSDSINEMGLKHRAREVAVGADIPVIPGTELLQSEEEALSAAERLGYPVSIDLSVEKMKKSIPGLIYPVQVMLKATGGGGGMGLQICHSSDDVSAAFGTIRSKGEKLFKNSGVFLEKYYTRSRHIEVQVFGNGQGTVHFGERECSIQRRHQKVRILGRTRTISTKQMAEFYVYRLLKKHQAHLWRLGQGFDRN
jgi:acetyl/propionyl-CoA carboxylase alpha subunit